MVSSTKSMIGHSLGATGAMESIACIKAIQTGVVPPTINLDNKDERIPDMDLVPHKAKKVNNLKAAMNNSFGFGGHNATLIFKKYE